MIYAFFNFCLYFFVLLTYYLKYKRIDVCLFVLVLYTTTSALCLSNVINHSYNWQQLTLFPFIFLCLCVIILNSSLANLNLPNSTIVTNKKIDFLIYIFIISGVGSILFTLPTAISLFQSGEWASLRNSVSMGESEVVLYNSNLERLLKNINSYMSPFAYVYAFNELTREKIHKSRLILLLLALILPSFLSATLIASRGMIASLIFQLIIGYLLFQHIIPKNRKKIIKSCFIVICILLLFYLIAVTISRFGEEDSLDSILFYFSHSMLSFNQDLMQKLTSYSEGKYLFSWFIDLFGGNSDINAAAMGGSFGTAFVTFVGMFYLDFGPIGTFLLTTFLGITLHTFFHNRKMSLSLLLVVHYVATYLSDGIFVTNPGGSLKWLFIFILYLLIRNTEK